MLLRAGEPADAGELHVLTRAAFLVEGQRYGDLDLPPLREQVEDVAAALADPATAVLVAEAEGDEGLGRAGRILGTVRLHLRAAAGEDAEGGAGGGDVGEGAAAALEADLARLAVAPDAHRRGIADALMEAAERVAARAGVGEVALFTGAASAGNLALYRRRGYREVPRPAGAPEGDLVFLRKALGPAPREPDGAGAGGAGSDVV